MGRRRGPGRALKIEEFFVIVRNVLIFLVRLYRATFSKWLGPVCRFEPSCSAYALACLERHGALRGSLLSVKRLCKCHPFHPGGFDPPPLLSESCRTPSAHGLSQPLARGASQRSA